MAGKNGVSDLFGKLLSLKSGSSAHSTQQCKPVKIEKKPLTRPYMAEACGGCDDDTELYDYNQCCVVGGYR